MNHDELGFWTVEHVEGSAQELHDLGVGGKRILRVNHVTAPALVLGSRQRALGPDRGAASARFGGAGPAGLQPAIRRSGGGAVRLAPGEQLWVDLVVPVPDPLHHDDIRVAAQRVGELWCAALGPATSVWRGPMTSPVGQAVCFAALGPGEVTVGGRKLVGISQRRTREWSRFQCVAYHRWVPGETLALLDDPWSRDPEVVAALGSAVAVLGEVGAPPHGDATVDAWVESLLGRLVAILAGAPTA